jgi:hypothetical protein
LFRTGQRLEQDNTAEARLTRNMQKQHPGPELDLIACAAQQQHGINELDRIAGHFDKTKT